MGLVFSAKDIVNLVTPAVTFLVANLLKERVIILKKEVLDDKIEVQLKDNEHYNLTLFCVLKQILWKSAEKVPSRGSDGKGGQSVDGGFDRVSEISTQDAFIGVFSMLKISWAL